MLSDKQRLSEIRQLLTWYLNPKKSLINHIDQNEPYLVENFATLISNYYKQIYKESIKPTKQIDIDRINLSDYDQKDAKYLNPLQSISQYAKKHMEDDAIFFSIHGSVATKYYIKGWSDIDTFLVIKSETILSKEKLINFRRKCIAINKFIKAFDPLSHHGIIYCTEMDLNSYYSLIMPIEVLDKSFSLIKKVSLEYNLTNELNLSKKIFKSRVKAFFNAYNKGFFEHHILDGQYLKSNFTKSKKVMYQLKYFLGLIMTMPAYYLEAIGDPTYKLYSFDKVKPKIAKHKWSIIEISSNLRSNWSSHEKHPFLSNDVPDWMISELGKNYFYKASSFVKELEELI